MTLANDTSGERSGSASVSSVIARPVASTASSWGTSRSFATTSQASAASNGRAIISQSTAMLVNSSRLSPATALRLRKPVSALVSRHWRACSSAASNSGRQAASAAVGASRTFVRSAGGTPAEPTIAASSRRSSSDPRPRSKSHSTIPWAKPTWPSWAPAWTSVAAIRTSSGETSWPPSARPAARAASRALSNSAAASCTRPATASVIAAWPRASGLSGWASRNSLLDTAAAANCLVPSSSFVRVAIRQGRPGYLSESRRTWSSAAEIWSPSTSRSSCSRSPTRSAQQNLIFLPVPPGQGA